MKFIKVPFDRAEDVKTYLMENDLFDKDVRFEKDDSSVYFPLVGEDNLASIFGLQIVEREPSYHKKILPLKDYLKDELSDEEVKYLKTAFDIIGTIAVLEIPKELKSKELMIAKALLDSQKNIKTVVKKSGGHEGVFRVQKMVHLAGEPTKETIHRENGVRLKLNIEEVYFSPRLSTERKRISSLVCPGEEILVMFSGCAPYPCVLSKNTAAKHIVGVEMNPKGHFFGLENLKLNKVKNVELFEGDVRRVVPSLEGGFDRIIMPLPHTAEDFLDVAFSVAKNGSVIHMYNFLDDDDIPDVALAKISSACKKFGKKFEIINVVKCGQFSPRTFRVCVDFRIL